MWIRSNVRSGRTELKLLVLVRGKISSGVGGMLTRILRVGKTGTYVDAERYNGPVEVAAVV